MISVSEAWKEVHEQMLLPESFLEISLHVGDTVTSNDGSVYNSYNSDSAVFSNSNKIIGNAGKPSQANYATLEHNLWVLDGSRTIMPDSEEYDTPGYVRDAVGSGSYEQPVTISVIYDEVRTATVPGLTIVWSSEYGDYPTSFYVSVLSGDSHVNSFSTTTNDSNVSKIDMELSQYDRILISVVDWCLPDRRVRIDSVFLGHVLIFDKNNILSYTHEQSGDLLSGELPKNSIEFAVNNIDGRWNPSNPDGLERYLSERQQILVRYGLSVNGRTEWTKAGTFYMSEWRAPNNGLEAHFVARDIFEFLMNTKCNTAEVSLADSIEQALSQVNLPDGFSTNIHSDLSNTLAVPGTTGTVAEIVQMCANAASCLLWQDREGVLNVQPVTSLDGEYVIPQRLSYSHPEVELSKPLKGVVVTGSNGEETYVPYGNSGEDVTVNNPMIRNAQAVAEWVRAVYQSRKSVSGEFRADPRLDLFDVVQVESKYGVITPVMLTNIKYAYTGAFKATYTGRVISEA